MVPVVVCVESSLLGRPELGAVAAVVVVVSGGEEESGAVGIKPTKYCMLCPVLWGSEHVLERLLASLNATVADASSVQLQNDPGRRVVGFPSCEQAAHTPSLLSQSVSAIQGWSNILC